jgi:hypothetical protein
VADEIVKPRGVGRLILVLGWLILAAAMLGAALLVGGMQWWTLGLWPRRWLVVAALDGVSTAAMATVVVLRLQIAFYQGQAVVWLEVAEMARRHRNADTG